MTSIMRRAVRGTAAGLGAFAIIAGAAACGGLGGGEVKTKEPAVEKEKSAEESDPAAEDGGDASSDDGGSSDEGSDTEGTDTGDTDSEDTAAAAGEAITEEDLTAVGDRFYEFLEATAANDGTAACAMIINPMTDAPIEGTALEQCAEGFEGGTGGIDPSMLDAIDRSMIKGVDNGDGTAGVTMMDQDGGMTFLKADDGKWYIDGSDFI